MKNKIFKITLFVVMLALVSLTTACSNDSIINPAAPDIIEKEDLGEHGKVELAFPIISDIHFSSSENEYVVQYYKKALDYSIKQTRNRLGAVVVPGDFSEGYLHDYDTLIGATRRAVGTDVKLVASYGNHEGNGKHYQYEQKFGKSIDNITTINGYNLIVLGAHANDTYTAEQDKWLDENLAEMTKKEPNKPVFVIVHHPVYNTHNVNEGVETFSATLKKYAQAFVITGHDHSDFTEKSLWKGEFISFRNSYLKNEVKGQYSMLRITDKNIIVIQKFEVKPGEGEPYIIGEDIVIDFGDFLNKK